MVRARVRVSRLATSSGVVPEVLCVRRVARGAKTTAIMDKISVCVEYGGGLRRHGGNEVGAPQSVSVKRTHEKFIRANKDRSVGVEGAKGRTG